MNSPSAAGRRRELAHRAVAGMDVTLYWSAPDDRTSIELRVHATEELMQFSVAKERSLHATTTPSRICDRQVSQAAKRAD